MCRRNNPLFHSCYKRQLIVKGPCGDPGIFFRVGGGVEGGGGGLRSIWYVNYPFPRFQRRSNIFGGGSNFFQRRGGGVVSNCLFPIETHITCDFTVSPSGSAHEDTTIRGLNLICLPPRTWSYLSFKTVKVH